MVGSSDEREIRNAVVIWLRCVFPDGRIIHELNCGHGKNRIDIACVTPNQIISFEIKSKKDTLKRLSDQVNAFYECSHAVVVVAHEKFFEHFTYASGGPGFRNSPELRDKSKGAAIWCYPIPRKKQEMSYAWKIIKYDYGIPDTRELLRLLWTDELRTVAKQAGFKLKGMNRIPGYKLTRILWKKMTGNEIEKAVCRALRSREFAEADAPIF